MIRTTLAAVLLLMAVHQSAQLANETTAATAPSTSAQAVTSANSTQSPATTLVSTTIAKPTSASTAKPTSASTAKPTSASTAKPTSASTAKPTSASTAKPTSASTAKANTTSTTTTSTTTAAATTTAKKKPQRLCKFPFWHRNEWRHECVPYGSKGARWCSLTRNFTRDEEWRDCARYDLMRYKCSVPFHHAGKTHTECQPLQLEPLARRIYWCSLVPSISSVTWANLGTDWTFCESANATGTDYLRAVGGFRSQADAEVHRAAVSNHSNNSKKSNENNNTAAVVASAHGETGDSKSVESSSSESSGRSAAGTATPSSVLGVALGIVGVILAAVAVAAAFAVHRRNQYKRIDPLLSSEQAAEKSSYGGMQAYHD